MRLVVRKSHFHVVGCVTNIRDLMLQTVDEVNNVFGVACNVLSYVENLVCVVARKGFGFL